MTTPTPEERRYVDLRDDYFKNSLWSNDPTQLQLDAYFHPQKPNLGKEFGIKNLRPIIKRLRDELFLLTDDKGLFYLWQPDDGNLFKIKEQGLDSKKAVGLVINGIDEDRLVQTFHPPS